MQSGALTCAVAFGSVAASAVARPQSALRAGVSIRHPNAWVTMGTDDWITLISPASEMGQGVMTSIPLLIAEEMDADWRKVRIQQAPADAKSYGNPLDRGEQSTGSSATTRAYYQMLRLVGAQTRIILLACAATTLGVPASELSTEPGVVVHRASGRRLSYGAIARTARVPSRVPTVTPADLKAIEHWRYLGRDQKRVDIPAKINGTAQFGIDVRLPEMLFGAVARAPVQGEMPTSIEDSAARRHAGLIRIVPLPYGVGVIAESTWAARKIRDALRITWSNRSPARRYSSDAILAEYSTHASEQQAPSVVIAQRGNVASALHSAARVLSATYTSDHVHQATMEPPNATARLLNGQLDIWGPFQAQTLLQRIAAQATGLDPMDVAVHTMLLGGGFGRKYEADFGMDAVLLAQAMPGKPVKVTWTREDDIHHGKYRPLQAQFIRVGLDAHGAIIAWHHRIVAESIMARYAPQLFNKSGGLDAPVTGGIDHKYSVPNFLGEFRRAQRGVDVGFCRAVGPGYTKFAVECMLDEVAAATGTDPLAMRLALLEREPRAQRVLRTVAEMCNWTQRRSQAALGIAYSDACGSHCAQVAEIQISREAGEIRVVNVWCAVDPGTPLQPVNIEAQIMGGIVQGISFSLHEKITLLSGIVQQSNFNDYRVLRLSEVPTIQVRVLSSAGAAIGGIGEAGVSPIGAAIANAFAVAGHGARLRHYPFKTEKNRATHKS
jgi:isoquinoline 1-oxidoreductase beta subunit